MTFWEHLDALRSTLVRIIVAALVGGVVAFFFKEPLFNIVLAPSRSDFITYRWLSRISAFDTPFHLDLINVELAQQFMIHLKIALYAGLLLVSPYVLYAFFDYISPALYPRERGNALKAVGGGYLMFIVGLLICYLIIFPLTLRFLATYQVSESIVNHITLTSYISTLLILSLSMGIVFELPILCWLMAKMGILRATFMKKYRRHAIVIILILAAIITPSGDAFTLFVVSLPIYLLYELSILIVGRTVHLSAPDSTTTADGNEK